MDGWFVVNTDVNGYVWPKEVFCWVSVMRVKHFFGGQTNNVSWNHRRIDTVIDSVSQFQQTVFSWTQIIPPTAFIFRRNFCKHRACFQWWIFFSCSNPHFRMWFFRGHISLTSSLKKRLRECECDFRLLAVHSVISKLSWPVGIVETAAHSESM